LATALRLFAHFPWQGQVLFDGQLYPSDRLPAVYLPQLIALQLPEVALFGLLAGAVFAVPATLARGWRLLTDRRSLCYSVVIAATLVPLVHFIVTRPIFDVRAFEAFLKRIEGARLPVLAGVFPFESGRNAEFMANEVPGVRVPDALLDRMRRADGLEAAAHEGIAIAREIASDLRGAVQGVQVSTQSGDTDAALAVLDGLR
jgi:hypothetical protein